MAESRPAVVERKAESPTTTKDATWLDLIRNKLTIHALKKSPSQSAQDEAQQLAEINRHIEESLELKGEAEELKREAVSGGAKKRSEHEGPWYSR